MRTFLVSFDTNWCGEDKQALARANFEGDIWSFVDNWAYNEFMDCGHDYSDFGYKSEEEFESDTNFFYEDYFTVNVTELEDPEELEEYKDLEVIYEEEQD